MAISEDKSKSSDATAADTSKTAPDSKAAKLVELSEEDKQLKETLEGYVQTLQEPNEALYSEAIEGLATKIKSATSSMTSVPKPLKFLYSHYATIISVLERLQNADLKRRLSDVVSVLAMAGAEEGDFAVLKYKLQGTDDKIETWGHEYVSHLSAQVGLEYSRRVNEEPPESVDDLMDLVHQIIKVDMDSNAETDACDLLMEINQLPLIEPYVDKQALPRVCLYLSSCVNYVKEPEDHNLLVTTLNLFRKFDCYAEALNVAIRMNDKALMLEVFQSCPDLTVQKQMAYMLGRQQILFEEVDPDLQELMRNNHLNRNFLALARDLDVLEPKSPEDVYKTHLETARPTFGATIDSASQNLSSTFVSAFVNAGFGTDKLMMEDGNKWLYKNKDMGMFSAAASLGLVLLWDVEGGLSQIDKYLYATEDYIKGGALMGCGLVSVGVRNECDPAVSLLSDHLTDKSPVVRMGAAMGIGLATAGSARAELLELYQNILLNPDSTMELVGMAALALGLIFVGSNNAEVTELLLQVLMERDEAALKESHARYIMLALGLNHLGQQHLAETTLMALEVVPAQPLGLFGRTLVDVCAYTGTANVLPIQKMLHLCSSHIDVEKNPGADSHLGVAVIGIAAIALGEDVGAEMSLRSFNNLLQYGEPVIRRAVPLGLALLCASNPSKIAVIDTLSKLSHDTDAEVAHNSIFALGIIGAGTGNARIANMLRALASFYYKDPANLFMVRLAQGLVAMGKNTMTLAPLHSERQVLSPVALAGLLIPLVAGLDIKNTILGKAHYYLYFLSLAMNPRLLQTLDEEGNPVQVTVRVGQAVDVVGQAGKPKTITGFQTNTTPVLLSYGDRAELATNEYIPLNPIMEGFVIVKKNPDYVAPEIPPVKK